MQLQIELASIEIQELFLSLQPLKEPINPAKGGFRNSFQVFCQDNAFDMFVFRSASAVSDPYCSEEFIKTIFFQISALRSNKTVGSSARVVGALREKVRYHLRPVDSLPDKCFIGKLSMGVP